MVTVVHVDSEVTYIMLSDGTQITTRGWVVVERGLLSGVKEAIEGRRKNVEKRAEDSRAIKDVGFANGRPAAATNNRIPDV